MKTFEKIRAGTLLFVIVSMGIFSFHGEADQKIHLKEGPFRFRLETHSKDKAIRLYRLGSPEPLPDEMTLRLMDSRGGVLEEISLQAMDRKQPPSKQVFAGQFDPKNEPFMGLELKFRIGKSERTSVIRWKNGE